MTSQFAGDLEYINLVKRTAHDLKSPLAVIINILSKEHLDQSDLAIVQRSSKDLKEISHDLLSSRPNQYPERTRYNLCFELHEIIKLKSKEYDLPENAIKFSGVTTYLWINRSNLNRIFSNILNNSIEMTKTLLKMQVWITESDSGVVLNFKDNGPGFTNDQIAKFNAGESLVSTKNGSGIGLSNAFEYLRSESCKISIRNDHGAVIQIVFLKDVLIPNTTPIILIDDDKYIRHSWMRAAAEKSFPLKVYDSIESFEEELDATDRLSEIYIDLFLGNENQGELYIGKLKNSGFSRLSIQTGMSLMNSIPDINGVYSKLFPY